MTMIHITAYQFVKMDMAFLQVIREQLHTFASQLDLKGTILLSTEGINLSLAGEVDHIKKFQAFLKTQSSFEQLIYKTTEPKTPPFAKLIVKIKPEIITMGSLSVDPTTETAPYISPEQFKQWYDQQQDMVVLDVRNKAEVALGTFSGAIDLQLNHFSEFPKALAHLPESLKEKPIVTFCTGGIRCEKAALLLQKSGFQNVYQLDGGILNYFAVCGGDYFEGECFVFDNRCAVNTELQETDTEWCSVCSWPISSDQGLSCDCQTKQATGS